MRKHYTLLRVKCFSHIGKRRNACRYCEASCAKFCGSHHREFPAGPVVIFETGIWAFNRQYELVSRSTFDGSSPALHACLVGNVAVTLHDGFILVHKELDGSRTEKVELTGGVLTLLASDGQTRIAAAGVSAQYLW